MHALYNLKSEFVWLVFGLKGYIQFKCSTDFKRFYFILVRKSTLKTLDTNIITIKIFIISRETRILYTLWLNSRQKFGFSVWIFCILQNLYAGEMVEIFKKKGKYSKLVLEFPNAAVAICRYLQKCVSPYTCMNTLLTVGNAGKCRVQSWVL